MSNRVVDSSAVLAVVNQESGAEIVIDSLEGAMISAVNACEVLSKLIEQGASRHQASTDFERLGIETLSFDPALALAAASLLPLTRHLGLSLGDRACLALAQRENLPVLTADHAWKALDLGVEVVLIR